MSTLVEWRLTPLSCGGTELYLRESGFLSAQSHQDNTEGWQEELNDLVNFIGASPTADV